MKVKVKDANRLNELIIRKGFTKTDFSKEIGMSQPMTIQIVNGDRSPSPKTAKRMTEVLEVEFDDIFVIERAPAASAK
ncbi:helix-turn-helix transcriptional regulator [Paenibacillus sp. MBLB4367]|uniref:helix-turn-helix transcriptional regulator n=1 Tax=Paenibacillus sp. MBLB4367 TaxID=3384767 RepID=UPI003907F8E4